MPIIRYVLKSGKQLYAYRNAMIAKLRHIIVIMGIKHFEILVILAV